MSTEGAAQAAEPVNAPGDLDGLEKELKAAVNERKSGERPSQVTPPKTVSNTPSRPDYIPEKFWTGDLEASIAKMNEGYRNLESAYGRMANDLGTQRKLTDRLLEVKRDADLGQSAPAPKVDPRKLVDNPTETLDSYWKEREQALRKEWENDLRERDLQTREAQFAQKHPDYAQIAPSQEFLTWVQADPFRTRAAALAGQGDFAAADDLLSTYKASRTQRQTPVDPNLEAARRASTESTANASESKVSSKRIYRRADLIELKINKPEVYADPKFQEEIRQAYLEKRVK